MKFKVTYHAQDRLDMREISLESVKQVVRKPLRVVKQGGNYVAEGELEKGLLRVVYAKKANEYIIISIYYVD